MTHPSHPQLTLRRWPGWLATVGLIAIVVLRCIVTFVPQLYWAIDPRAQQVPSAQLGPAGAAVIDWLCVAVLALAVLDTSIRGRRGLRVRIILIALWAIGLGFALYQGTQDAESLRIGGNWIGSLALGLAAAHLGTDRLQRRTILAAAVALLIPLSAGAIYQVAVEHPLAVRNYQQNREQIAQQRGWEEGSVQQRKFEERLMQTEATGRFGFSNVLASVAMTLTLLTLGVAAGSWRTDPRPPGYTGIYIVGGIALLGLITLALTFSKGAAVAFIISGAAAIGACWIARRMGWGGRWFAAVGFAVVACGIAAVLIRGAAGPPDTAAGERSLLFRYHYWQAAASMWADQPLAGVGPGRFQQQYLTHKNPLSPEEVADPHNVFVAYISTLGLGGLAWSMLVLALLWSAAKAAAPAASNADDEDPKADNAADDEGKNGRRWAAALTAGAIAFGAAYLVTLTNAVGGAGLMVAALAGVLGYIGWKMIRDGQPAAGSVAMLIAAIGSLILLPSVGVWLIGGVGFIAITGWLSGRHALDSTPARIGLFAAALALLLHSQISLSLTNTMAAPLLFVILGMAAAGGVGGFSIFDFRLGIGDSGDAAQGRGRRIIGWSAFALTVIAMGVMLAMHTGPIVAHQAALRAAARQAQAGSLRTAVTGPLPHARTSFQDAAIAVSEAQLWMELAATAHQRGDTARRNAHLDQALQVLQEARRIGSDLARLWRTQAMLSAQAAELTGDRAWLTRAVRAARQVLKHDPYGISAHVFAADLAWRAGEINQAKAWYQRALELSDLAYLDPNKQLPQADRERIRQRREAAE